MLTDGKELLEESHGEGCQIQEINFQENLNAGTQSVLDGRLTASKTALSLVCPAEPSYTEKGCNRRTAQCMFVNQDIPPH